MQVYLIQQVTYLEIVSEISSSNELIIEKKTIQQDQLTDWLSVLCQNQSDYL